MNYLEIISIIISSGSLFFVCKLSFSMGKIIQKIDSIDKTVNTISVDVSSIKERLSHLEGAFEERGRIFEYKSKIDQK